MSEFHQAITTESELEFFEKYGFYLQTKNVKAGTVFYCHWHDYYEFEMVIDGVVLHTFNNKAAALVCGCAYLITPTESHRLDIKEDTVIVNLRFKPELLGKTLSDFLKVINNAEVRFSSDEINYISDRINTLCGDSCGEAFYYERSQSILSEILILFFRKLNIDSSQRSRSSLIQETINYISNHFREDLSIKKTAKVLAVTPKYLGSLFKQQIGTDFNDYLNNLRLQYACNLLNASDASVKEVAFSSGYNSEQYFIYIFKKYINATPSEYRILTKKERDV